MFSGKNTLAYFSPQNLAIWLSMSFQAGAINAGGFLACHRFVSHVTGFATLFGAELAQGHPLTALGMLAVPAFFVAGSCISAFFIDRRIVRGKMPLYPMMFGLISLFMLTVTLLGSTRNFGSFGEPMSITADFSLLALLCLSSGIQNATITSASGAVVRTTHLTGITTDLGIGLVRVFASGQSSRVQESEFRANLMRLGIIFFFIAGSTISAFLFLKYEYLGFLIPVFISLGLMLVSILKQKSVKTA